MSFADESPMPPPMKKSLSFSPGFKNSWGNVTGLGVLAQYAQHTNPVVHNPVHMMSTSVAAATSAALKSKKRKIGKLAA